VYIESLEIFNFGKIKYKKLDFVDGLIVTRGLNEAGKSTALIQCPLYCFFGSSTLDCPITHVVTDGEPVNSLKVIVKYGPYTVTRSKTSASVSGGGMKPISGQAEVSDFFYKLFGVYKNTEKLVLVSTQGDTAGVISKGSAEVTKFIEDIAGFNQIDQLLDKIKEVYPTGNEKALKGQLETAEAEQLQYQQEELPDVKKLEEEKLEDINLITAQEIVVAGKRNAIKILEEKLKTIELVNQSITNIAKAVTTKKSEIQYAESALTSAQQELEKIPVFNTATIEEAQALVEGFPEREKAFKAHQWVSSIKPSENFWDESEEALVKTIADLNKNITRVRAEVASAEGEIKSLKKGIQVDTVCTKCGTDVKDKVEAINKKIAEDVDILESKIRSYKITLQQDEEEKITLDQILTTHQKLEGEVKQHGDFILADCDNIPHHYSLSGEPTQEPSQQELTSAKEIINNYQQSLLKLASCDATIKEKTSALERLRVELTEKELELTDAGQEVDTSVKRKEIFDNECELTKLVQTQTELNTQLTNKEKEIVLAKAKIETNKNNLTRVAKTILNIGESLKTEDRNSKIIKSVRDAKPLVLNQVWNKVLDYTQQSFSEMRGEDSVVEKSEKGFTVDARPTSRLSGSAKSILGISLRAAVRDIFAPTAGFMIFDEPFGDMDEERTAAALAAIQTIRGQKFIVTHESQSEMAADQVVEI